MEYWQFSVLMSLLMISILVSICIRVRVVLGGRILRITTPRRKTAMFLAGLAIFVAMGAVIAPIRDMLRGAPDIFMEVYRYYMFRAIPGAVVAVSGFIGTYMEGQIRVGGIYYRGMHTWDQILYYYTEDCVVWIATSKTVWLSGKQKWIKMNLQDRDPMIDVTRALESHGIRGKQWAEGLRNKKRLSF